MLIEAPYKVGDTVSIKLSLARKWYASEEENDTHVPQTHDAGSR